MKKSLFMIVAFIISAILYYLFWMFALLGNPPFTEWTALDRGVWLFMVILAGGLGANIFSLFLFDWYYHLDDVPKK